MNPKSCGKLLHFEMWTHILVWLLKLGILSPMLPYGFSSLIWSVKLEM